MSLNFSEPPTQAMLTAGVDWFGVKAFAKKACKLLLNTQEKFIEVIVAGFQGIGVLTEHDMSGIIAALRETKPNIKAIVLAIQSEFGLLDGTE